MNEKELWKKFVKQNPCYKGESYEAWCYGSDTPDLLLKLTVEGVKTATASAYPFYEYEQCELPKVGDFNIILDTSGSAVCITKNIRVKVVPFLEVSEEQAYKEGEGDRSLAYWRKVHTEAFTKELVEINEKFSKDMLVVCEEFKIVFSE